MIWYYFTRTRRKSFPTTATVRCSLVAGVQGHMTSNVANISQRAALAAVAGPLDEVHEMRKAFDARRRAIVHVCPPEGIRRRRAALMRRRRPYDWDDVAI